MKFTDFSLHEDILKGIKKAGFEDCTEVQEQTFSKIFTGKDVAVQSQTGTGKTAAFLIPIFQLFLENREENKKALIVAPTRELAVQIEEEAKLLGSFLPFTTGWFYGGVGYGSQEQSLSAGVDIIIGTPGRLLDFMSSGKLSLSDVGIAVIDEADRMFDMGFLPDLRRILSKLPPVDKRRTLLFSATLSYKVKALAWEYMHSPEEVIVTPERITVEEITQELYHVSRADKFRLLLGLLEKEKPGNLIIFTNTKRRAEEISKRLEFNNYPCTYIIGDMPQKRRLQVINGIKQGKIMCLVATDVAARGLHIDDLSMVINYDIPEDYENYVHRIGRTARAGKTGKAVSLACEEFVFGLPAIEEYINMKIPVIWPDAGLFGEDKSEGIPITRELRQSKKARQRGSQRQDYKPRIRRDEKPKVYLKTEPRKRPERTSPSPAEQPRKKAVPKKTKGQTVRHDQKPQPVKSANLEDRLDYYRKKYGENFTLPTPPEKKKLSLVDKIRFLFKGGKG